MFERRFLKLIKESSFQKKQRRNCLRLIKENLLGIKENVFLKNIRRKYLKLGTMISILLQKLRRKYLRLVKAKRMDFMVRNILKKQKKR